jgi:hypothetical protein
MRKLLLFIGVVVTPFLLVGLAHGQAGTIGIFTDTIGTQPHFTDDTPGEISFYVVHINTAGATACQFSAPKPDCFDAVYLGDEVEFPVAIGSSQEIMSIGYGACLSGPVHVATIHYYSNTNTPMNCPYSVTDYLQEYETAPPEVFPIAMVDCEENILEARGGTLLINPDFGDCAQPSLELTGYQTVDWTPPYWSVQVMMKNAGAAEARNVSATVHEDIYWLFAPDPTCYYGTIAAGDSSYGGLDNFVFDLTAYSEGSFNAWFEVTYEDTCGNAHYLRLDPEFDAETLMSADVEGAPIVTTSLGENFPNPFNPTTTIPIEMHTASFARLAVYDSQGKLVRTLVNEHLPAGVRRVVWNGRDTNGSSVSSGIYFARLTTGATVETRKLVLLK